MKYAEFKKLCEIKTEKRDEEPSDYPKDNGEKDKVKKKKKRSLGRPKTSYDTKVDSMSGNYPGGMQTGSGALYMDDVPQGNLIEGRSLVEQARDIRTRALQAREQGEREKKKAAKERMETRIGNVRDQKERLSDRITALQKTKERISEDGKKGR